MPSFSAAILTIQLALPEQDLGAGEPCAGSQGMAWSGDEWDGATAKWI